MASPVFFAPLNENESLESIQAKVLRLYEAAGFDDIFSRDELLAIKIHFGEEGNKNYIRPERLAKMIGRIKERGGKPFWAETNTLYMGRRSNAVDHMLLAEEHGFSVQNTGIPVVITDGVSGREETIVEIEGRHAKQVGIAPGVAASDSLLVVTHATGHPASGFGGAIKNLGMGLSSRRGKLYQHSVVKPRVHSGRCVGDGACLKWCPTGAISLQDKKAFITVEKCIGCGECLTACRPGAVKFEWKIESQLLQERMVEQAYGVVKGKPGKVGYLTFITDVGKNCDCFESREKDVLIKALGIVASRDLVALEYATLHLIEERLGKSLRNCAHDIDYTPQLTYAEEIGLGCSQYQLREI